MENNIKIEEYESMICCPKCGFRMIRLIYAIGKPSYIYCFSCKDWVYKIELSKSNFDINHREPDLQNVIEELNKYPPSEEELKKMRENRVL